MTYIREPSNIVLDNRWHLNKKRFKVILHAYISFNASTTLDFYFHHAYRNLIRGLLSLQ